MLFNEGSKNLVKSYYNLISKITLDSPSVPPLALYFFFNKNYLKTPQWDVKSKKDFVKNLLKFVICLKMIIMTSGKGDPRSSMMVILFKFFFSYWIHN